MNSQRASRSTRKIQMSQDGKGFWRRCGWNGVMKTFHSDLWCHILPPAGPAPRSNTRGISNTCEHVWHGQPQSWTSDLILWILSRPCVKEAQMSFTTNQTHRILKVVLRYEPFSKVHLKRWWRGRCLETWKRTELLNLRVKKAEREYWGYKWSLNDCFHQKCSFSLVLSDSWVSELTSLWC